MNIIEQIRALPDDCELGVCRTVLGVDSWLGIDLTVVELKALAESHERLLAAANDVVGIVAFGVNESIGDEAETLAAEFVEAIKQAEKLTKQ
jgi:hypothetical protein